jgi:hypothetical protein
MNEPKTAICQFFGMATAASANACNCSGVNALEELPPCGMKQRSEVKEAGLSLNGNPRE